MSTWCIWSSQPLGFLQSLYLTHDYLPYVVFPHMVYRGRMSFPLVGTRGNKVYRHRSRYYVYNNHLGSCPDGFGLQALHEIPRNVSNEEFE
jgi:hypothetical protein